MIRLDFTHVERTILPSLGMAAGLVGIFVVFGLVGYIVGSAESACALFVICSIPLGYFVKTCINAASRYESWAGWAEIAVRGGSARWGGGGGEPQVEMVAVGRFEVIDDAHEGPLMRAILPDGRRLVVYGPWNATLRPLLVRLADEMNANLGVIDAPETAA